MDNKEIKVGIMGFGHIGQYIYSKIMNPNIFKIEAFFKMQLEKGGPFGPDGPGWPRENNQAPNGHGLRHYPDAVREAFKLASGDILIILDADLTVQPEELPKFYRALIENKADFINGSRFVYPLEKDSMRFLNMLGNKFFSGLLSFAIDQKLTDTLCGTKAMFKEDYLKLERNRIFFGNFDPFGDFDLIFGAAKLGIKIMDIPIRYQERVYGETQISRFYHGWLLIKMTLFALRKIKFI